MGSIQESLLAGITGRLYFATLVGVIISVLTILLTPFSLSSPVAGEPIFLSGVIVGIYYSNRQTDIRDAAIRAGLVSSIGLLVPFSHKVWVFIQTTTIELKLLVIVLYPVAFFLTIITSLLITIITASLTQSIIDE